MCRCRCVVLVSPPFNRLQLSTKLDTNILDPIEMQDAEADTMAVDTADKIVVDAVDQIVVDAVDDTSPNPKSARPGQAEEAEEDPGVPEEEVGLESEPGEETGADTTGKEEEEDEEDELMGDAGDDGEDEMVVDAPQQRVKQPVLKKKERMAANLTEVGISLSFVSILLLI